MPDPTVLDGARHAVDTITCTVLAGRNVVVGSPPGAGKTHLLTVLVPAAVAADRRVAVVANTNEQAHQLLRRLADTAPQIRLTFAPGSTTPVPADLHLLPSLEITSDRAAIADRDVLVCTADKASFLFNPSRPRSGGPPEAPVEVDLLVVDEGWQLPWAKLLRTNRRFGQIVLVGDPGQLDPFSPAVLPARWRSAGPTPISPAPSALLAAGAALDHHQLPATWRLPPSAADVVSDAFYADLPFRAVSLPEDRTIMLRHPTSHTGLWEQTIGAGFGLLELDEARPPRHDPELAASIADAIGGLLATGAILHDERGQRPLQPADVVVIAAHRDQRHTARRALDDVGLKAVAAHTANTVQGLEFEVSVVWHPLSGRQDPTGFHLDAGRLCVALSRHRHACLAVTRPGIRDLLDRTALPEQLHLDGEPCPEIAGWRAHRKVLRALSAA